MARGPGIARRVDHILAGVSEHAIGRGARAFAAIAVLVAATAIAGAHAKEAPAPAALPLMRVTDPAPRPVFAAAAAAKPLLPAQSSPNPPTAAATHRAARAAAEPEVTYNPRALLERPDVVVMPSIVPVSGKGRGNSLLLNGSTYVGGN